MKILTIYDGTLHSKSALNYALQKTKETGGEVVALQVFPSNLFVGYDAHPRAEALARAEAAQHAHAARQIMSEAGSGVHTRFVSEEGDPEEEILRFAASERPDLILAAPRYKAITKAAPCPVYIMPGTILVPVDNSDVLLADLGNIAAEAKATGSKVLLLGVVAVHMYGAAEKKELETARKSTTSALRKIRKALSEQGIESEETTRSGYTDEEILNAADEYAVSLIMLPAGGMTPSELTKAAAIILDEPERLKRPVYLMPAEST